MLDLDDTDKDSIDGVFPDFVKQRKPLEQWRLKPSIIYVSVTC
jgi:hypothetical protein